MTYEESARRFTAEVNLGALELALTMHKRYGKKPSYQQIATMCGVSKGTITNLMTGTRKNVNPETAQKIEQGLRVDPQTIFKLAPLRVTSTGNTKKVAA